MATGEQNQAGGATPAVKEPLKGDKLKLILIDPKTIQHDTETGIVWSTIQVHSTKVTPFVAARLGKTLREATKEEIEAFAKIRADEKAAQAKTAAPK